MASVFGWGAAIAVLISATVVSVFLARALPDDPPSSIGEDASRLPPLVIAIQVAFLTGIVFFAHHPVIILGLLLCSSDTPGPTSATRRR